MLKSSDKKLIRGHGICDIKGATRTRCYQVWSGILHRCFSHKFKDRHPDNNDTFICKEWLTFSNFKIWFDAHYVEGFQISKDLLNKNNKLYSPGTCIFVPNRLKSIVSNVGKLKRDGLPTGVYYSKFKKKKPYYAQIGFRHIDKNFLGFYSTAEEAEIVYLEMKTSLITEYLHQLRNSFVENQELINLISLLEDRMIKNSKV